MPCATPKLSLSYGVRYEYYPFVVRDHSGAFRFGPYDQPKAQNVIIGGIGGAPNNTGEEIGWGLIVPRFGVAYGLDRRTVIHSGFDITEDPDNFRFMHDTYPSSIAQTYNNPSNFAVAQDSSGNAIDLVTGIPALMLPNVSTGYVSLPTNTSINTLPRNFRRGYIESWNLFVQREVGLCMVANVGYVGTHEIRQISNVNINAGPALEPQLPQCAKQHGRAPLEPDKLPANQRRRVGVLQQHRHQLCRADLQCGVQRAPGTADSYGWPPRPVRDCLYLVQGT